MIIDHYLDILYLHCLETINENRIILNVLEECVFDAFNNVKYSKNKISDKSRVFYNTIKPNILELNLNKLYGDYPYEYKNIIIVSITKYFVKKYQVCIVYNYHYFLFVLKYC